MSKISLFPSGGLDLDSDVNKIADGDYSDARNIVISAAKSGGGNTIKVYESIKSIGLSTMPGTNKASFRAPNGDIYYLFRTNSTTATIFRVSSALDTLTTIVSYTHNVATDFVPDFKLIGENIVWNYFGTGQLLYWLITRDNGATIPGADLMFVKSPPIGILSVVKNITLNSGQPLLENGDFQFCARYKYDNEEYSVISPFTEMFKGVKDTSSYSITVDTSTKPTYATFVEVFVRNGDFGTLRRIATYDISSVTSRTLTWKGDVYESLSDQEASTSFSSIPFEVGSIEVAVDRVIVGNFTDDPNDNSVGAITITANAGYTIAPGGTIKNYLNSGTTDAATNSNETGTYYKPFANNSTYSVGILLFDSAMKTRGVQYVSTFQTGNFAGPIAPSFSLNTSGYTKPSYAKYMQLAITKNLSKSKIYEGFASSLYFDLEYESIDKDSTKIVKTTKSKLSVLGTDVNNVKYFVIDISGMATAGELYSFQNGDRITINVPTTTNPTTDAEGYQTGEYRILDMPIVSADSQKVYCIWNGGECLNDAVPDPDKLYFEIYSVKGAQESDNVLFYAVGEVIDISSTIPSTITNYKLGDAVFNKFGFYKYTKPTLQKGLSKSVPAVIEKNTETNLLSTKVSGTTEELTSAEVTDASNNVETIFYIPLNGSEASFYDGGVFDSGNYLPLGYFDETMTAEVSLFLDMVDTITLPSSENVNITVKCALEKVPFDQSKNTFGTPVLIDTEKDYYYKQYFTDNYGFLTEGGGYIFGDLSDSGELMKFTPKKEAQYLNSGDKLRLRLRLEVTSASLGAGTIAKIEAKNRAGITKNAQIKITGNRIKPEVAYYARESTPISASKTNYVARAMSNVVGVGQWNTSSGHAFVRASNKFSVKRKNAFRHGGNIITGTSVNNIGQFSALNTYEVPVENGEIQTIQRSSRLQGNGDMLLVICTNETSYVLLGESSTNQASNYEFSSGIDSIIGTIRNLGERTGIQDRSSVYNHNGNIYWWDNSRSIICRFDKNGNDIISKKKGRSYFIKKDGTAKFAFDPFYNIMFVKIGSDPAIGYDVDEGKWTSYFDVQFDSAIHIGDRALFLKSGVLYKTLDDASGNKVGEYMGDVYDAYITLVANSGVPVYPTNITVSHNMTAIDYSQANGIKATLLQISIKNENLQETDIFEGNFSIEDNKLFAFVMRDNLSPGGIVNGNFVRGASNTFTVKLRDTTQINRIFDVEIDIEKVSGH